MCRFPNALKLVEQLNDEDASEDFIATKVAFGAAHLDNAVLSSCYEHDLLLCIEAGAAHTRSRKQDAIYIGHFFLV